MEKKLVPYSIKSLIWGIFSVVLSPLIIGVLPGIVGLRQAYKSIKIIMENENEYSGYGIAQSGLILSMIGIIIAILVGTVVVGCMALYGWVHV